MRKILFIIATTLVSVITHASVHGNDEGKRPKNLKALSGSDTKKFNLGLSVGTTIPVLAFGSKDKLAVNDTSNINGFAKVGFHFNLHAGYLFSKYIGGMIMIGGNINSFDTKGYDALYNSISPANPGAKTTASSHYVGQYLAGPYLSIPLNNKLAIEVQILLGLMTSSYPKITETYPGSNVITDFKLASGSAFGYSIGAKAKYILSDNISISLNIAYSGSSMSYPSYTQTTSGYAAPFTGLNGTITHTSNRKMATGMINASLGLVFAF